MAPIATASVGLTTFWGGRWESIPLGAPVVLSACIAVLVCWVPMLDRRLDGLGAPSIRWHLACSAWIPLIAWFGWLMWFQFHLWAQRAMYTPSGYEGVLGPVLGAIRGSTATVMSWMPAATLAILGALMVGVVAYCCTTTLALMRGVPAAAIRRREALKRTIAALD